MMISSLYSAVIIGLGTSVLIDRLEAKAENQLHLATSSTAPDSTFEVIDASDPSVVNHHVVTQDDESSEVICVIDEDESRWQTSRLNSDSKGLTSSVSDYNLVR